jgi:uncharacterized protein (TIGR02246 family)
MTDHGAITDSYAAWIKAFNGRDIEALVPMYSSDVVLNPPGGPELAGRDAARHWIGQFFDHNQARQAQIEQEVEVGGDWAYLRGRFEIEISERRTGPFETIRGAHLMIWKREGDGQWRIHRDLWNLT